MELSDDTLVYYLEFRAPGSSAGVRNTICVMSNFKHLVEKFIDIHLEPEALLCINECFIHELPTDLEETINDNLLTYVKFKNNGSNTTYMVPTTMTILKEIEYYVCSEISSACELGDIMELTNDIPIIKILSTLIENLDFAIVKDLQILEVTDIETVSYRDNNGIKIRNNGDGGYDDDTIHEMMSIGLRDAIDNNRVMPFSLKAYTENFTLLLFHPREWGC